MPVQVQTLSLLGAMQAMTVALMLWVGVREGESRAVRSLHLRAAALAVEGLGYGTLAFLHYFPIQVMTLGGNALNLLAQAMSVIALRMLLNAPLRGRLVVAVAVVGWLGVAWFAVIEPDYHSRVLWGSAAIACNLLLNIEVLFGGCQRGGSRARCVLLWIFVLSLLLLIWRNAVLLLGVNQPANIVVPSPTNVFFILLSGMQPLFYGLGFLLLYNELLQRELHDLARIDPLTGVSNRLALEEKVKTMLVPAPRARGQFSLLLIDADHFKSVNDRYGHDCGDKALKALVASIRGGLRRDDVLGRLGGEEFIVLTEGMDMPGSLALAERIRVAVERAQLAIDGHVLQLTISVGVALAEPDEREMATVLRRADKALYAAKHAGRNRVMGAAQPDQVDEPATT